MGNQNRVGWGIVKGEKRENGARTGPTEEVNMRSFIRVTNVVSFLKRSLKSAERLHLAEILL